MKHTKHASRGFTLIELLVVIAIIGILASVVLASLNTSRARAADAKIKSQLGSMRAQAQLYTGAGFAVGVQNCPTSGNTLFSETSTNSLRDLISSLPASASPACGSLVGLPSSGASWAVAAQLSSGVWCVDSTGAARDKNALNQSYTVPSAAIHPALRVCQ